MDRHEIDLLIWSGKSGKPTFRYECRYVIPGVQLLCPFVHSGTVWHLCLKSQVIPEVRILCSLVRIVSVHVPWRRSKLSIEINFYVFPSWRLRGMSQFVEIFVLRDKKKKKTRRRERRTQKSDREGLERKRTKTLPIFGVSVNLLKDLPSLKTVSISSRSGRLIKSL